MRVDNPEHPNNDRGFGLGADEPELRTIGLGVGADSDSGHGLFDQVSDGGAESFGGHVEVGRLEPDFGHHHEELDGLDGLHDSVNSVGLGLGFGEGADHHSLHEGLDAQHDHDLAHHDDPSGGHHEAANDAHQIADLF